MKGMTISPSPAYTAGNTPECLGAFPVNSAGALTRDLGSASLRGSTRPFTGSVYPDMTIVGNAILKRGDMHGKITETNRGTRRGRADRGGGSSGAPAAGALTDRRQTGFTVIANHLNNPRGLSPAPGGGFYLAEAGSGGSHCVKGGEEGTTCVGLTGSLDEVDPNGEVERIVGGLISASARADRRRKARCRCPPRRTARSWPCSG